MSKFKIGQKYTDRKNGFTFEVIGRSKCYVELTDGYTEGKFRLGVCSKIKPNGERVKQNECVEFGYSTYKVNLIA